VVSGYPPATPGAPPTYRPSVVVDRAQMAVFMTRALYLPTQAYAGTFDVDVSSSHWAWPWIEALADAGIVAGYGPGVYQPEWTLTRDQMAAFVAYGMEGQRVVPSGPAVGTFDDVPDYDPGPAHWAYDEIEYCVAHGIVGGYTPTIYQPGWDVTRDQMAVFVYRGFMMATGCAVVLGGPEITALDPATVTYYGWCSVTSADAGDPGYAYVIFDGARLDYNLAYPQTPTATWEVTFELRGPTAPTPSHTISWDQTTDIQGAYDAVTTNNGVPYTVMYWDIPAGLTPGDYTLVVLVEDPQGNMNEVARQPSLQIQ